MIVNAPEVIAEVRSAFDAYEAALLRNDTATLDAFFLHRPDIVRYGVAEVQYGIDAIRAFRSAQSPFDRALDRLVIVAFGPDVAVASTMFYRDDFPGQVGRQQQTWVRTEAGWKIGAAHVSMMQAAT
jgi:hypothetical protein